MKQVRNVDECDTEVEIRTVDEDDEGTSCSEEEQEDDNDLKSLDWLISYRLPAFYSPLFDDSAATSESMHHSSFERPSLSKSDDDNLSPTKLSTLICAKQLQGKKNQQQQSNCSTLYYLYRILTTSSNRAISLTDIFQKFFELNRNGESLSPDWKQSICNSLLSSSCIFPLNALESQRILWTTEDKQMRRQQRSMVMGGHLHECLQRDATSSSRNDKDKRLSERKNGSKRAVLFMPYSKNVSQRLKRANCNNELSSAASSKRSLTAVIIGEHCYQKSASFLQERTPQK